jgi:ABC-type sugar transport system ATPase subunit
MTEPIIHAAGLVKRFGKVEALTGLDLVARSGKAPTPCGRVA